MSDGDYIKSRQELERQNAIEHDRGSWLAPFAAGIGAIGLGAYLLKTRLAEGGELLSNLFNFLGIPKGISLASDAATNTGKSAIRSNTSGLRSVLTTTFNIKTNQVQVGPIDLIDDLRNSIDLIGLTEKEIAEKIKERTVEYTNRLLVNNGANTSYFTHGLQRVTFGQVLKDQATWSRVLGDNQFGVVKKASELGLIKDDMLLDKKLYINTRTNELLDLRLRNLVSKVKKTTVGDQDFYERVGRFDLFGQSTVISSLYGSRRNIAVIGPGDGYQGSRVFIDGNIYGYARPNVNSKYQEVLLAENRFLRKAGDPLEIINASRTGRLQIDIPKRKGMLGSLLTKFEEMTGVGPSFSNRPSIVHRWIIDPYNRARALASGEGVIFKHPFHRQFGLNKVVDAALGGDMPEMAMMGGHIVSTGANAGEKIAIKDLSSSSAYLIPDRVGVLFDLADDYSVIKKSSYNHYRAGAREALVSTDLIVPTRKGGYKVSGKVIPSQSYVNQLTDINRGELTAVGFPSVSNTYGYYGVARTKVGKHQSRFLSNLKDFAAWAITRTNSLASESLLGVGFAPTHKIGVGLARLAAIPLVYGTALKTAEYADYLVEKFTGVSPIKAAASIYAGARVVQQKLREVTGIRLASDFLDTYFPGSINSDGSTLLRSVGAPIIAANALLKRGSFLGAAIAALGTYGAIGGPEPNQTASDLIDEYSGDKKVPVRRGQFWGLGYLPFTGGKVERYDYSWYAKLTSDYRTKSLYGSKSEYWSYHANVFGIPFPTPSNLFGLLNLATPYRMESMHYNDRPYPQTESNLSNFPIFGPILSKTLGQLIKPTIYRQPTELPLLQMSLAPKGLTPSAARQYGIPAMNATKFEAEDPNTLLSMMARQANIASEPFGIYKFAMEFFGMKLEPDLGSQYATSATMESPGRFMYDLGIGGALGQTELLRRYMLSDYNSQYRRAAEINPIRNNQPNWLPGSYSANKKDQKYFIDFTLGDPYAKIADGEARLPGPGYEALNDLHSGRSGNYDDVDRFLILSDVAPYSDAYRQYERRVLNMDLEPEWQEKVQQAVKNRQEVIGVDTRYKRYEEDIISMNMSTLTKSVYAPVRKAYDFLTHDILAEIPYVGSKLFPFRSPYEQYRKMYVEGSEFASWDTPWEDIIRPGLYDMALEDPVTAAGKGAMLGFLMSGPMRWFTPINAIVGEAGGHMANMAAVRGGAMIGAGLSALRIASFNSQDMIPYHVRDEQDAIQYMDTLNYVRNRVLGQNRQANNTMLGAPNPVAYRSALPRSADRRYFDYFNTIEDKDTRSQIFEGLPTYMQRGLSSSWNQNFLSNTQADTIALDFVNNNPIPDSSWMGWNPQVSDQAVRLRLLQHGINGVSENMHRYGFYESHEIDLKTRLQEFNSQEINFVQSPMSSAFNQFIVTQSKGTTNGSFRVSNRGTPMGSRKELTIKEDRDKESFETLKRTLR